MRILRGIRPQHIERFNLTITGDSSGSGSLRNVEEGVEIIDGFRVFENYQLIGWAVVFKQKPMWFGEKESKVAHFLVHPDHRRKKIGSTLFNKCKQAHPEINVVPWDSRSRTFFQKVGAI